MTIKHSIYTSPEFPQDRERRLLGLDYDGNLTFEGGHVSPLTVIPTGGVDGDARALEAWALAISGMEDMAAKGVAVASAATVTLGAGRVFHITGSTGPITDIDFADPADGRWAILVFDSTPTLTHSSTLSINGATDFTAAADDRAIIFQDSGDTMYVLPFRKSGKAIVPSTFSEITSKPTTLSGYGITDATAKVSSTTATAFAKFSDTAGTLANSVLTIDSNAIVNGGMYRTTQLSIADDAVGTFTCPANTSGHVALAAGATSFCGFASFRAGSTPGVTLYTGSGGSVAATTGALTGTTGTDGKATISTHTDSIIYIENRAGATSAYGITILVR